MPSEIQHIVSFSGGAASFKIAADLCEKYDPKTVLLAFCDTIAETEDTYQIMFEAVQKFGCWFYYMRDGRTPWRVFKDRKFMGNSRTAHCSQLLKRELFLSIIGRDFPPAEDRFLYFGFDWKEKHRHERAVLNWAPYNVVSPLTLPPFYSREQVFQVFEDYELEIPSLYKDGFRHNNCGGKCVRGGLGHWALLLEKRPFAFAEAEAEQEKLIREIPNVRPFLQQTINKVKTYLTLKQFREQLEAGVKNYNPTDIGGCGCFSEDE